MINYHDMAIVSDILDKESWNYESCLGLNELLAIMKQGIRSEKDAIKAKNAIDCVLCYTEYDGEESPYFEALATIYEYIAWGY